MEQPKSVEEQQFEHSINNTRIENERNELLAHVKARVEAQAKARCEKTVIIASPFRA